MKRVFSVFTHMLALSVLLTSVVSCEKIEIETNELSSTDDIGAKEESIRDTPMEVLCPDGNHPHAVDLGLSTKWSCCNVEAESPDKSGGYYAWGEVKEKADYSWHTYELCNHRYFTMTKYCTNGAYAYDTVDNKTALELADDAAFILHGNDWRMPTADEFKELYYNCSWEWTRVNGQGGQKFTGPNGNSIFLPAAGCKDYMTLYFYASHGHYWSNTLHNDNENLAFSFNFVGMHREPRTGSNRSYGHSVRPVKRN